MVPSIQKYFNCKSSDEWDKELLDIFIIDIWWEYAQFHICQVKGLIDPEHKWKEFGKLSK